MKSKHIFKYITLSIIVIVLLIVYGSYSLSHTGTANNVQVKKVDCTEKEHVNINDEKIVCEEDYYIVVDDEKLVVENKNTWNLIKEDRNYDLEFEWYGFHTPKVKSINIAGEGEKTH
ncbi:hypothetical protein [Virgibacillus sp. SK37]|uniref:hypothetical protein n=1 Tax=Virgibacillus sp. SK37 TaxID=403957 RepID=UPI0004D10C2A|nr:hypothetical protein [Virgibacillus sp. SK37]AIF45292.1 hypothetical protein X953_06630 [Virgibacillus sp. SK37]